MLIVPELPSNVDATEYTIRRLQEFGLQKGIPSTAARVGVLDKCAALYPKLAHSTIGLLSLAVARRPSAVLATLDPDIFCKSIGEQFLHHCVFRLVHNSECRVEESYGLVSLLNSLPTLYYITNVKHASTVLLKYSFPALIASLAVNPACASMDEVSDRPIDLETFPELTTVRIVVAPSFGLS